MKEKIDKLREDFNKARVKLIDAEDKIKEEVSKPMLRKSIGKCFKYMNSYGISDNCRRWLLYIKIVDFDEKKMNFKTIQFQKTTLDSIEIKFKQVWNFNSENYFDTSGDYIEITNSEFERARKSLLKIVDKIMI